MSRISRSMILVLRSGGSDFQCYSLAFFAANITTFLIYEVLCNEDDPELLWHLLERLQDDQTGFDGYLQARLSDVFREVVVTFCDYGREMRSAPELRRVVDFQLCARLYEYWKQRRV